MFKHAQSAVAISVFSSCCVYKSILGFRLCPFQPVRILQARIVRDFYRCGRPRPRRLLEPLYLTNKPKDPRYPLKKLPDKLKTTPLCFLHLISSRPSLVFFPTSSFPQTVSLRQNVTLHFITGFSGGMKLSPRGAPNMLCTFLNETEVLLLLLHKI